MELILVLLTIFTIIDFVFLATHVRPLNEKEIERLGNKRRNKQVSAYFSFDAREFTVDKQFKKRMKPTGTFYELSEDLWRFPSVAAALLKYKKHEWIIVAFEKGKKVDRIWVNKGYDRSGVSLHLPMEGVVDLARSKGHSSILVFHNHPNPNPTYLDCTKPSRKDVESAGRSAAVFNRNGINLMEFICERGRHYRYFLSIADSFLPLSDFTSAIQTINGSSKLKNLSLHLERIL
jgi:hypothetical protein